VDVARITNVSPLIRTIYVDLSRAAPMKLRSEDGKYDLCDDQLKCIKREAQLRK